MARPNLERSVKIETPAVGPYPGQHEGPAGARPASGYANDTPPHPRLAFLLLGAMQFALIAAISLVVAALPAVQAEFGVGRGELALVTAGYGLAFAGLLLLGGRLADWLGPRRVFVWGVLVFGAASAAAALAPGYPLLLAARFAQGCGAALAAPAALALVPAVYPDPARRARALAVWGGLSGGGAAGGLLLSGVLVTWFSWRWAFGIPALAAIVVVSAAPRLLTRGPKKAGGGVSPDLDTSHGPGGVAPLGGGIPMDLDIAAGTRRRPASEGGGIDVTGGLLAASGLATLCYGLVATETHGWLTAAVLVPVLAAVALLSAFVWVESRVSSPLLPLSFLASRRRAVALLATVLSSGGMASSAFFLALYLQQVRGFSPLDASAAFLPYALIPLVGPAAARLVPRLGPAGLTGLGLGVAAVGLGLLARLTPNTAYAPLLLVALVIYAIGAGHAFSGATVAVLEDTPAHQAGLAGGVLNTAMEVGPTVGLALRRGSPRTTG